MSVILENLERHSRERGDENAIIADEGTVSWRDLAAEVNRRAAWISMTPVTTVAFQLDNGVDWVVTDLACMKAGVAAVPLPQFFSDAQVIHALRDSGAGMLIAPAAKPAQTGWATLAIPGVPNLFAYLLPTHGTQALGSAKVTYTSGSTGAPKGVRLSAESIDAVTTGIVESMASISLQNHLCVLPLATLLENIAGLYAPIVRGISVTALAGESIGLTGSQLDPNRFAATLSRIQPDSVILVPQLLTALVTLCDFGLVDWPAPKMIAVGGGRVSQQLLSRAEAHSLPVFQGYGLSEACSVCTLCLPDANKPGSVGKALPHVEIRISDIGEIEVRGATMTGYLGDETVSEERWYPTGDLGRIDEEGFVFIEGRRKNVFVTAFGRNVNPEWPESALTSNVEIAQALACGEAMDHNVALVWLRFPVDDARLVELLDSVNGELPDYAQITRLIPMEGELAPEFMTDNGRLKRNLVLDRYGHLIHQAGDDQFAEKGEPALAIL